MGRPQISRGSWDGSGWFLNETFSINQCFYNTLGRFRAWFRMVQDGSIQEDDVSCSKTIGSKEPVRGVLKPNVSQIVVSCSETIGSEERIEGFSEK